MIEVSKEYKCLKLQVINFNFYFDFHFKTLFFYKCEYFVFFPKLFLKNTFS